MGLIMKPMNPVELTGKKNPTEDDVRIARLDICNACEHLQKDRLCVKCYCYVDDKTRNMNQYCPLRKW